VLVPYIASLVVPRLRSVLRARLQARLTGLAAKGSRADNSRDYRITRYLLAHMGSVTSGAHVRAVSLAVFYFAGAYYSLSKRALGLRYVFTRRPPTALGDMDAGSGYEVLGALLVVQMAVRAWLHVRATMSGGGAAEVDAEAAVRERMSSSGHGPDYYRAGNVSLDANAYSSNNELLVEMGGDGGAPSGQRSLADIATTARTPLLVGGKPRYDLRGSDDMMAWIKGRQQRTCTLCLEGLKDPSATQCGHVFCWTCIEDWIREKPECPLCRREALVQHILPLRTV
jgi:peroxin-10